MILCKEQTWMIGGEERESGTKSTQMLELDLGSRISA